MKSYPVSLPNGFMRPNGTKCDSVNIRKLDGRDEDFLADEDSSTGGEPLEHQLLQRTILSYGDDLWADAGNKDNEKEMRAHFRSLILGDMLHLVIALRVQTLGSLYRHTRRCPSTKCKKANTNISSYTIDLTTLAMTGGCKELDDGKKELSTTLSSGKVVVYRPLTLGDTLMLAEINKSHKDSIPTHSLMLQILSINGAKPDIQYLQEEFSWADRSEFREVSDEAVRGPDINLEYKCVHCETEWTEAMPIGRSFFSQGRKKDKYATGKVAASPGSGETSASWLGTTDGAPKKSAD